MSIHGQLQLTEDLNQVKLDQFHQGKYRYGKQPLGDKDKKREKIYLLATVSSSWLRQSKDKPSNERSFD